MLMKVYHFSFTSFEIIDRMDFPVLYRSCFQVRYCPPIAARASYLKFYLHFEQEETIYKFSLDQTADILAGVYMETKLLSEEYPQLSGKPYSALFLTKDTDTGLNHVHAIVGQYMLMFSPGSLSYITALQNSSLSLSLSLSLSNSFFLLVVFLSLFLVFFSTI